MSSWIFDWRETYAVLRVLNRRAELQRLTTWAKRKRYAGPRTLYTKRLIEAEIVLTRYTFHSPRCVVLARFLHRLNTMISKPPRYPRRGLAAAYR
jgi:hypothetical protein